MVSSPASVECPIGSPMHFVDIIADYMRQQYRFVLDTPDHSELVIPDLRIPLAVVAAADQIIGILVKARRNTRM